MALRRRNATTTPIEVRLLLEGGERERVALATARTASRKLAETLAALANANGGTLVLGVTKGGVPQAGVDIDALRDKAAEAALLTEPPLILPNPQTVTLHPPPNELLVVVVQIPPGLPHLYSLGGRYLTRTGPRNRTLTTPELRRLLLDRGDAGFESQPAADATLGDLDGVRVNRYLDQIGIPPDEEAVQVLLSRGCVVPGEILPGASGDAYTPTHAGILLFGREPQRFVRSAEIICVRYASASMSDEFARQDFSGTLADQVRQAEAFVTGNMRRGMKISGMAREETTEYPLAVVREAIVNAVAHRDYSIRGEGIRLLMFSDRLELYSPGRLPGHVTLDNLKDERYSRNEAIVAVLSDMGYIERLGYGIDRMIATMRDAGLPEPTFEETAAGFQVTLYSTGEELVSSQPEAQPWQHVHLNERQEQALAHIAAQGRITNSDYQLLVPDVSAETIRRDLVDLVDKNLLIRIGEKRATYYILK